MSRRIVIVAGLVLILVSMLGVAVKVQMVKGSGTVYIRADGSVDPPTAPIQRDGNVYTFTSDIIGSIVVERDNITIDGKGHRLWAALNGGGIMLYRRRYVTIKNAQIEFFDVCIRLNSSSNNTISRNKVAKMDYGIVLEYSSNNKIYHNNFLNNPIQVDSHNSINVWDDGYPSGGNYWSDYVDGDACNGPYQNETGSDGIGDKKYRIDANNKDRYPLMGPISFFEAGTWDDKTYYVHTVSNSTVSDFHFSEDDKLVNFNVTGRDDTFGFCRVAVPKEFLWCDFPEDWIVLVNNTAVPYTIVENDDHTYLYFTYNHTTLNVQIKGIHIIPEFPSPIIMPLLMIATLLAAIIHRRKHPI